MLKKTKLLFAITFSIFILVFYLRSQYSPQLIGEMVYQIKTNKKVIALTIDDGPSPGSTSAILELLKKHKSKATFFVTGENVKKNPTLAKKIILNKNEIGNHSWDHSRLIFRTLNFIKTQLESTDLIIRKIGYKKKIYFRAPYGNKLITLPYYLKKTNRKNIHWDIIVNDWENPSVKTMMLKIDKQIKNGAIILLHDGYNREATIQLIDRILKKYTQKGYKFITISELLNLQIN